MPNAAPSLDAYKHLRRGASPAVTLLTRPESAIANGAVSDVIDWLGRAVASGHFPIGATLPMENQRGEQVGVSRSVIREAVKVMTAKGVLKTARRYGTVVNPLDDWNLLDADIVSWHKKGDAQVILIFRELVELLSIMLPQAVAAALGRLPSERGALAEMAIGALQSVEEDRQQRVQAEFTIWALILEAPQSNMFAQFKALTYEMIRLTQEFEEPMSRSDALYSDILHYIGSSKGDEANLACRLLLARSKNLI